MKNSPYPGLIPPDMSVLDVVSIHKNTLAIFKQYDGRAGECICCTCLFDSVGKVAQKYNFDLTEFILALETAAETKQKD